MKTCSTCKALKPFDAFYKNFRTLDGYVYQCKECQNAYSRQWAASNPDKRSAQKKSYYQKNRDKVNAWTDSWVEKNPEKIRAKHARYYARHAPEIKVQKSLYRATKPEMATAARNRYRARKRNASGSHTAQDIQFLFKSQKGCCTMCRTHFSGNQYHVDHIMPLARGGSNEASNLQLLCPTCNLKKSAKHPVDFAQQMGFLL